VTGQAQSAPREQLVEHLLRVMEQQGFTIEAASVRGHRAPGRMRRGLKRTRLAPDVVARDGRRSILGIALDRQQLREPHVSKELGTYAGTCRMLVICVAQEQANAAIHVLFDNPMPNWRKMRLLRCPGTNLEEVSRMANEKKLRDFVRSKREAVVHVLPEEE
jgi:hypothetical protein